MASNSAAILIGNHPRLPGELWSGFVKSGLVGNVATFSSVGHLVDSFGVGVASRELDVKLIFFLMDTPEDLAIPIDLKTHPHLSMVPLIGFYGQESELTETDIQTLYERRVSSVIRLPLGFHDMGQLVLKLDRYWSMGQLPECYLSLPLESLYQPR